MGNWLMTKVMIHQHFLSLMILYAYIFSRSFQLEKACLLLSKWNWKINTKREEYINCFQDVKRFKSSTVIPEELSGYFWCSKCITTAVITFSSAEKVACKMLGLSPVEEADHWQVGLDIHLFTVLSKAEASRNMYLWMLVQKENNFCSYDDIYCKNTMHNDIVSLLKSSVFIKCRGIPLNKWESTINL